VVEVEKLEWTKVIEVKKKNLKPSEQFEVRFGWKGILLPFEDTTGINRDNRDFFLHGEEPNQPLAKLFFFLRFALDENTLDTAGLFVRQG
jgi:hypothetical protein